MLVSFLLPIIIPSLLSSKCLQRVVLRCRAVRRRPVPPVAVVLLPVAIMCRLSPCCTLPSLCHPSPLVRHPLPLPCRPSPSLCRMLPCCSLPSSCCQSSCRLSPSSCRPSPLSCRVVMPPVTFCVPWQPIGGIRPNQGTVALPMMHIWSECSWICETGADGVNKMTSMTMMSSCQKYHGCAQLWMEVPYPTVA